MLNYVAPGDPFTLSADWINAVVDGINGRAIGDRLVLETSTDLAVVSPDDRLVPGRVAVYDRSAWGAGLGTVAADARIRYVLTGTVFGHLVDPTDVTGAEVTAAPGETVYWDWDANDTPALDWNASPGGQSLPAAVEITAIAERFVVATTGDAVDTSGDLPDGDPDGASRAVLDEGVVYVYTAGGTAGPDGVQTASGAWDPDDAPAWTETDRTTVVFVVERASDPDYVSAPRLLLAPDVTVLPLGASGSVTVSVQDGSRFPAEVSAVKRITTAVEIDGTGTPTGGDPGTVSDDPDSEVDLLTAAEQDFAVVLGRPGRFRITSSYETAETDYVAADDTARDALSPTTGETVVVTDTWSLYQWNGSAWVAGPTTATDEVSVVVRATSPVERVLPSPQSATVPPVRVDVRGGSFSVELGLPVTAFDVAVTSEKATPLQTYVMDLRRSAESFAALATGVSVLPKGPATTTSAEASRTRTTRFYLPPAPEGGTTRAAPDTAAILEAARIVEGTLGAFADGQSSTYTLKLTASDEGTLDAAAAVGQRLHLGDVSTALRIVSRGPAVIDAVLNANPVRVVEVVVEGAIDPSAPTVIPGFLTGAADQFVVEASLAYGDPAVSDVLTSDVTGPVYFPGDSEATPATLLQVTDTRVIDVQGGVPRVTFALPAGAQPASVGARWHAMLRVRALWRHGTAAETIVGPFQAEATDGRVTELDTDLEAGAVRAVLTVWRGSEDATYSAGSVREPAPVFYGYAEWVGTGDTPAADTTRVLRQTTPLGTDVLLAKPNVSSKLFVAGHLRGPAGSSGPIVSFLSTTIS